MTTVVLVHGLWMPGAELTPLRRRLRRAGFDPVQFRYRSVRDDLQTSADALDDLIATFDERAVDLVGHSLGGLVMLKLVERFGVARVRRLVCLGSPFAGSAAGTNLRRLPGGRHLLGRAMAQVLAETEGRRWDGKRELGIVAGSRGIGLGRMLGRLPGPHDGTVAVAETRLPGATDHVVLPVTHFSMLTSRAVADQVVAFLRRGRFEHRNR
jgi:pimeloyl-ACP methyl ester carboxylesterase